MSWSDPRIAAALGGTQSRRSPSAHRGPRALLAGAGGAGFVAALLLVSSELRHLMRTTGGACASGGPYVIAHPCPQGSAGLITLGVFGIIGGGALLAGGVAWGRGPVASAVLLMWSAMFGLLGADFLSVDGASVICGVIFEVMAAAGLTSVVLIAAWSLRQRGVARR